MHDLNLLIEGAREAGEIAQRYFRADPQVWDKGGDAGPVTEADLAIDQMLKHKFCTARPDYGWLSEETADTQDRLAHSRVFIVDPIDGTRAFVEGKETFATSLAIIDAGIPVVAAIYLPMLDLMFTATHGGGAALNGAVISASAKQEAQGGTVLTAKPNMDAKHWHHVPPLARHFRSSLAYRLSLVAQGRFDAMITLRPSWEWDIAAGDLIAREAGATVTDRKGAPLRFNNTHPQVDGVLAAAPALHPALMAQLKGTS